jgi:hypothetical protein
VQLSHAERPVYLDAFADQPRTNPVVNVFAKKRGFEIVKSSHVIPRLNLLNHDTRFAKFFTYFGH